MTEEIADLKNALVENITARKIIEDKLAKAKGELAKWQKREGSAQANSDEQVKAEIAKKILDLKKQIAGFEVEIMALQDEEKSLNRTLRRLESAVKLPPQPKLNKNMPDGSESINRIEGMILEKEALVELTSNEEMRKLKAMEENAQLDEQLKELKLQLDDDD